MSMPKRRKVLADGSLSCKPIEYAKTDVLPNTEEAQSVVVGVEDCMMAPPAEDPAGTLTGRYYTSYTGGTDLLVSINQAGLWLELWITRALGRTKINRTEYRLSGSGQENHWELFEPWNPEVTVGTITVMAATPHHAHLKIDLEAYGLGKAELWRYSAEAVVSDGLLNKHEGELPPLLEPEQRRPLHPEYKRRIYDMLTSTALDDLIRAFFALDPEKEREELPKRLEAIDGYVRVRLLDGAPIGHPDEAIFHTYVEADGRRVHCAALHRGDIGLFRFHAELALRRHMVRVDTTRRPAYEWLQTALYLVDRYAYGKPKVRALRADLKILPIDEDTRFMYGAEITAVGADGKVGRAVDVLGKIKGLPPIVKKRIEKWIKKALGGAPGGYVGARTMIGLVTIRKTGGGSSESWEKDYVAIFQGVRLSHVGSGMIEHQTQFKASGWMTTSVEWSPDDFCGVFHGFDGAMAGDGYRSPQMGQIVWSLDGGSNPEGFLFWDEVQTALSNDGVGMMWGYMREVPLTEETVSSAVDTTREMDYVIMRRLEHDAHFVTGSPLLTEDARMAVRMICANELALLRSAYTEVFLTGYADRVDRLWYNESLSKMRASNTLQAMFDVLGEDLCASTDVDWKGERAAKLYGLADGTATRAYRRVNIVIGGRLVGSLRVFDPPTSKK